MKFKYLLLVSCLCVAGISLAKTPPTKKAHHDKQAYKAMKPSQLFDVALINEMVQGKKTWVMVPSNATFKRKTPIRLKVVNTLNEPHGLEIPGLLKPQVIAAHAVQTFVLEPQKPGTYAVKCQLHPAHVGTKFMVR